VNVDSFVEKNKKIRPHEVSKKPPKML